MRTTSRRSTRFTERMRCSSTRSRASASAAGGTFRRLALLSRTERASQCGGYSELPVDTVSLARYLIGKILVREIAEGVTSGRIVETEAYVVGDAAGHAYRGMTPRNRSLFLERGHAYVYLVYGSACMLNVSSERAGIGAGVLIRALEPGDGIPIMHRNRQIEQLRDL